MQQKNLPIQNSFLPPFHILYEKEVENYFDWYSSSAA